jgi:hypothetical protein
VRFASSLAATLLGSFLEHPEVIRTLALYRQAGYIVGINRSY